MIRVLTHGCAKYAISCSVCSCVFLFEDEDIVSDKGKEKWIFCPECGIALPIVELEKLRYREKINPIYTEKKHD